VVDDQESICQLLQEWLTLEGHGVHQARDFDEMRGALEEEPFDLVTLDIAMPGTDGLEILWWINEHHPDVGVLMATALGGLHTVIEAMQLGTWDYLLKPFNMELVLLRVERAMQRRRLLASKSVSRNSG